MENTSIYLVMNGWVKECLIIREYEKNNNVRIIFHDRKKIISKNKILNNTDYKDGFYYKETPELKKRAELCLLLIKISEFFEEDFFETTDIDFAKKLLDLGSSKEQISLSNENI